jgi:hypothetical protein
MEVGDEGAGVMKLGDGVTKTNRAPSWSRIVGLLAVD